MLGYSDSFERFLNVPALVAAKFELDKPGTRWLPAKVIAEILGVPVTLGSCTQIGRWASKAGISAKKTNGVRMLLMPPLRR